MASEIDLANLSLPISNTVNKQLEKELHDKQKQIDKLEFQVSQHNDRIQVLSDHLNNVQQELQLSQALYEARKGDVETEKHLLKIAEREEGKLKDGCQLLKVDQEKLTDSMNTFENSIFKSNTKIEEIRKKMNLDQQALEAWLEESARRDEDALTITKYTRADENKIKELNLKLEQLHETYVRCKRALDNETMDTLTAQVSYIFEISQSFLIVIRGVLYHKA
jgi:UDP-glucose:O-linked fucose beta-1,3-glucosyltransferase